MKKYVFYGITCFIGAILNFLSLFLAAGSHSEVPKDIIRCIFFPIYWMGHLFWAWKDEYGAYSFEVSFLGLWIGLFLVGVILLRRGVSPYRLFLILPVLSLTSYIVSLFYGSPFGRL